MIAGLYGIATSDVAVLTDFETCGRPGDHVIWKTEDQKRAAIVQSVNAVDRIAQVRCEDNGQTELASLLDY